jgi:tRNA(fMet)-specific endonuclease VapC
MKYVLDTNTVSALMRAEVNVLTRLRRSNRRSNRRDVGLPQPVVAELDFGIARLPKSRRRQLLEDRFEAIASTLERVAWTDAVSTAYGHIKAILERKGRRIEDFDAAIAAHALANDATLVIGNVKPMADVPALALEDWLAPS